MNTCTCRNYKKGKAKHTALKKLYITNSKKHVTSRQSWTIQMRLLEYFTTSTLPLSAMLISLALTQVSHNPTLFMEWVGSRNYAKSMFILHKVNNLIYNLQACL